MCERALESKRGRGDDKHRKHLKEKKICTDETDAQVLIIHLYFSKQHANSYPQLSTLPTASSKSVAENWRCVLCLSAAAGKGRIQKRQVQNREHGFEYSAQLISLVVIGSLNVCSIDFYCM